MTLLRATTAVLATVVLLSPAVVACGSGDARGGVVLNEINTDGGGDGDWVELANTGTTDSVDVSGWGLADDDHDPLTVPADSVIEPGGYLVVYTEPDFGLGTTDSLTLTDADGTEIDSTSWSETTTAVLARVPDLTGDFADTATPTPGLSNDLDPWPADPLDTGAADLTGDYAADFTDADMSGVDIADDGTAYVVNNAEGTLYVLTPGEGDSWSVDGRYQLRYPDGSGHPDAEGVTVGPDGSLYVATERDGDDDQVSRPSVLRFDIPTDSGDGELTATDEWNLSDLTGELDANEGLEAISWISDAATPDTVAVGVEGTAEVLILSLGTAEPVLVQRYVTPLAGVMGSDYDAATGELTVLCDETCGGASQVLTAVDGQFVPASDALNARPETMDNVGNEGYAHATTADGTERFLWTDDSATGEVSLRGAVR
ncbi:lamin tail domain-containing protein [Corynebacterium terpenotabidum]|uniref:LTD domain-containing protein n=1 Tax=Corynebacterium terpenotabidum Y-11 TaxID=1200352 RepID=S4XBI4_9CORY|nr:lamin tail domain-containing protein [Corynebacterium terpenotabidum]AGP30457.1 hypothetical protein A606_04040 [Corynebacterium terpenotabidum Y-11]